MHWRDIHRTTVVYTAPTVELVSLDEAKRYLRINVGDDDPLLVETITAARQQVERDTDVCLGATVLDLWFDAFPTERAIELPRNPVTAIASVKSYNDSDVEATLSSANYYLDLTSDRGRVVLVDSGAWPSDLRPANAGVIRFTAGYTSATVPQRYLMAIKVRVKLILGMDGDDKGSLARAYDSLIADRQYVFG